MFLCILLGSHPGQSLDGIVGDQIHFGADTPRLPGQKTGLLGGVVDIANQNILKSDSLFFKAGVVLAGCEQFLDRIFFIHGHDAGPHLIRRTMEGYGQPHLERLLREFADLRDEARRGNRHVTRPQTHAPRRIEDRDGADEIVVIGHGFSHAHEDDVVDFLARQGLDLEELIDDFSCMEVALPTIQPAGAKFASIGASDLTGHANGPPV